MLTSLRVFITILSLLVVVGLVYLMFGSRIRKNGTPQANSISQGISFTTIDHGYYSGFTKAANTIITSSEAFNEAWKTTYQQIGPAPTLTPIDFSTQDVMLVTTGTKNTGGYDIKIAGITETEKERFVEVITTSPSPKCFVTQALTSPYFIAITSKSTKPTKFITKTAQRECR